MTNLLNFLANWFAPGVRAREMMAVGAAAQQALAGTGGNNVQDNIAGAGTTSQANSTALTGDLCIVTSVAANSGVRAPTWDPGDTMVVCNTSATALLVFPDVGAAFSGLSTNASVSLPANKTITLTWLRPTLVAHSISA